MHEINILKFKYLCWEKSWNPNPALKLRIFGFLIIHEKQADSGFGLPSLVFIDDFFLKLVLIRMDMTMLTDLDRDTLKILGITILGDVIKVSKHAKIVAEKMNSDRILNKSSEVSFFLWAWRKVKSLANIGWLVRVIFICFYQGWQSAKKIDLFRILLRILKVQIRITFFPSKFENKYFNFKIEIRMTTSIRRKAFEKKTSKLKNEW